MAEGKNFVAEMFEKLKKDKKSLLTVMIGLFGILLILLSELPLFSTSTELKDKGSDEYINQNLEAEVEKLLSRVEGAGKVSVMLSYESDVRKVYATDKEIKSKQEEQQSSVKHIIVDSSDGEEGLVENVIYPRVRGVAIVCSGGNDPVVKSEIKSLVSALFDIGANRISIAQRAEEE